MQILTKRGAAGEGLPSAGGNDSQEPCQMTGSREEGTGMYR